MVFCLVSGIHFGSPSSTHIVPALSDPSYERPVPVVQHPNSIMVVPILLCTWLTYLINKNYISDMPSNISVVSRESWTLTDINEILEMDTLSLYGRGLQRTFCSEKHCESSEVNAYRRTSLPL
jgi:hypothetical protein